MQTLRYWALRLGLAAGLMGLAGVALAADDDKAKADEPLAFGPDQTIVDLNEVKWEPLELDGFPEGGEFALLRGDMKHGVELIARVPAGY